MKEPYEQERREFVRVNVKIRVRYKFLSKDIKVPEIKKVYEGVTTNISGGGLLLNGKIPDLAWISEMLLQKMAVGVNILLPDEAQPIKALTRVAWVESFDNDVGNSALGLKFKEITAEDRDKIFKYIIKVQMPS